jgi:CHAD domain-containing protein
VATVVREIERKYDPAADPMATLEAVKSMTGTAGVAAVSQQAEQILDAVYYDTADLRLLSAGITLRRRTGGEDAGWHLKLPAGARARDEVRLPLTAATGKPATRAASGTAGKRAKSSHARDEGAAPKELAALIRAYTRDAALGPVVRIQTSRRVLRLLDGASQTLAEVAADHVRAEPADGTAATSWDEIEAELVTGDPKLLKTIDTRLRRAGARSAATNTKLQRALAGRLPAAQAAQERLTAYSPAGEVVLAYVRDQVAAISRSDPLVRREEPDAIHQMRVATRRARSALQAFGPIVEREATRPLCVELKWLAATLGQARDAEVLQARLTAEVTAIPRALLTGPVEARVSDAFATERARARRTMLRTLNGHRYLQLLDELDALLTDPPLTALARPQTAKVLAKPVRRADRRLQRALAAVPGAQDRDSAIHEARKAAKRARYAAEAAALALSKAERHQAARAKELQQLLGDHHDSVVARRVLLDLAAEARAAGEDTFTYGLMHQRLACQAAEIEQALPGLAARAK